MKVSPDNNKICDCCFEESKNIKTCKYNHNICNICQSKMKKKECLFCSPLDTVIEIPINLNTPHQVNLNVIVTDRRNSIKNIIWDHFVGLIIIICLILYMYVCGILYHFELWLLAEIDDPEGNPNYFSTNWYSPGVFVSFIGAILHTIAFCCIGIVYVQKY